jgi:hypothetical protein
MGLDSITSVSVTGTPVTVIVSMMVIGKETEVAAAPTAILECESGVTLMEGEADSPVLVVGVGTARTLVRSSAAKPKRVVKCIGVWVMMN